MDGDELLPPDFKRVWGNLNGFKCYTNCFRFPPDKNPCRSRKCWDSPADPACNNCDRIPVGVGQLYCKDECVYEGCPRYCYKIVTSCANYCGIYKGCGPEADCYPTLGSCLAGQTQICIRDLNDTYTPWHAGDYGNPDTEINYTLIYAVAAFSVGSLLVVLVIYLICLARQSDEIVVVSRSSPGPSVITSSRSPRFGDFGRRVSRIPRGRRGY